MVVTNKEAMTAPALLKVVCIGCALGILIFLFFFFFVVLGFCFWLFEPVPAPSGVSHSSPLHLWGLTIVLPAPSGTAHLNVLGGVL